MFIALLPHVHVICGILCHIPLQTGIRFPLEPGPRNLQILISSLGRTRSKDRQAFYRTNWYREIYLKAAGNQL